MPDWIRHVCTFDSHVPEYVLFELMRDHRPLFDPIDRAQSVFAYRDVAQFRKPKPDGDATVVRVYLDVLKREARLYGEGPEAADLMRRFRDDLAKHAGCRVTSDEAVPDEVARLKQVGKTKSGKDGMRFEVVERTAWVLLKGRRKWYGNRRALADAIGLPDQSQITTLLNPTVRGKPNPKYNKKLADEFAIHEAMSQKRGRKTTPIAEATEKIVQGRIPDEWEPYAKDVKKTVDRLYELFPDIPMEARAELESQDPAWLIFNMSAWIEAPRSR